MKSMIIYVLVAMAAAAAADDQSCSECAAHDTKDLQVLLQSKVTFEGHDDNIGQSIISGESDAFMELATIVRGDLIDVEKMALDLQTEAAVNVNVLQQTVDSMKPGVDAARAKFKADRKVIRDSFKKCKKKITTNKKKWKTLSQCAPFVQYFPSLLEVQEENEVMVQGPKKTKAEKKAEKAAKKEAKKAAKEAKILAKCQKKPKCELRQAKLSAKLAAKEEFKTIRKSFREYKKQLRQAKFQKNILPKVIVLLKPELLKALAQVDMSDSSTGQVRTCEQALTVEERTDCIPLAEINLVSLLKNYMNVQLNGQLKGHFEKLFKKIKEGVWKLFDPPVGSIKNSLVAAVGTTPIVGGALAAAVGVIFDFLYKAIKYGVESSLDKVSTLLQSETVKGIVNAVFATGLFTPQALQDTTQKAALGSQLTTVADAAEKSAQSTSQKLITTEAATAQAAADAAKSGAESDIKAAGEEMQEGENEDEEEDVNQYEEEDAEDIIADDE